MRFGQIKLTPTEYRFDSNIMPSLKWEYPDVFNDSARGRNEIEVFKRKWVYYL